ncbi:MAG: glutathione S-transferase [Pseudomonadota bacterium]
MKIYWTPQTRASRLIWMAEEAGVDYEIVPINIHDRTIKRPAEFEIASPLGKVPALSDGDVHMADSAAMCLYLADRFAPGRLAPAADATERGAFLYWLFFTPTVVEPAMSEQASGVDPNPGRNGWAQFSSMLDVWGDRLREREWVLDSGFSAADVMLGSSAVFLRMFGLLPESASVLSAYADRCLARPGYARALAGDSADS